MYLCLNNQFIVFFLIKHFTKYTFELLMFYFSGHVCLQCGEDTTAIVARLFCCGLSLTSDDFKLLCHSCLCMVCSKVCLFSEKMPVLNCILRERRTGTGHFAIFKT